MEVYRDLDKPRMFSTTAGTELTARPGEDVFWNKEKQKYEVRNAVGGGRSSGRGGATAEELRDYEEEGLTTERKIKRGDYGKPGMAPMEPMPKPPMKKAKGGMAKAYRSGGVTRADGCISKGHTKGRMV